MASQDAEAVSLAAPLSFEKNWQFLLNPLQESLKAFIHHNKNHQELISIVKRLIYFPQSFSI